jgi:hypothetical protein
MTTFSFFITLLVTIALVGFCVWLLITLVPMDPKYATAIKAIAAVALLLYLLSAFGLFDLGSVRHHR